MDIHKSYTIQHFCKCWPTGKKQLSLLQGCKQSETDLNVSVFEVAEPEGLKALVDSQHCFNPVDKTLQSSFQLRNLVCQSNVLHYLWQQVVNFILQLLLLLLLPLLLLLYLSTMPCGATSTCRSVASQIQVEAMSRSPSEQVAWPSPQGQRYTTRWPLDMSRHMWTLGGGVTPWSSNISGKTAQRTDPPMETGPKSKQALCEIINSMALCVMHSSVFRKHLKTFLFTAAWLTVVQRLRSSAYDAI